MLRHLSRSTAVQLRVSIGILDLDEVGAGLGTGLIRWCCRKSPRILAVAGYGYSNCSLAGALFSFSL